MAIFETFLSFPRTKDQPLMAISIIEKNRAIQELLEQEMNIPNITNIHEKAKEVEEERKRIYNRNKEENNKNIKQKKKHKAVGKTLYTKLKHLASEIYNKRLNNLLGKEFENTNFINDLNDTNKYVNFGNECGPDGFNKLRRQKGRKFNIEPLNPLNPLNKKSFNSIPPNINTNMNISYQQQQIPPQIINNLPNGYRPSTGGPHINCSFGMSLNYKIFI